MKTIQTITEQWEKIQVLFKLGTNGEHNHRNNYGKNFEIGGQFDLLTQDLLNQLGSLTQRNGHVAVVEGRSLDSWKKGVWGLIEKAGLLEPLPKK